MEQAPVRLSFKHTVISALMSWPEGLESNPPGQVDTIIDFPLVISASVAYLDPWLHWEKPVLSMKVKFQLVEVIFMRIDCNVLVPVLLILKLAA